MQYIGSLFLYDLIDTPYHLHLASIYQEKFKFFKLWWGGSGVGRKANRIAGARQ